MSIEAIVLDAIRTEPGTLGELWAATSIPPREIQAAIEAMRKRGVAPICSGARGYWMARSTDEYAANVEARRRRALVQLLTVRGERRLLRRLRAPMTLWEGVA